MIVAARHPVALVHVPHRGRVERLDMVSCETQVVLREVGHGETEAVHPEAGYLLPDHPPLRRHGGFLWKRLEHDPGDGTREALRAGEFAEWLRGERDSTHQLLSAFAGTPLVALFPNPVHGAFGRTIRGCRHGEAIDPARSRHVRRDDREKAGPALRDYVAREVLVVSGEVHLRERPPAAYRAGSATSPGLVGLLPRGRLGAYGCVVADREDYDAMLAFARTRLGWVSHAPNLGPWQGLDLGERIPGQAQRIVLESFAGPVAGLCEDAARRGEAGVAAEGLMAHTARMRELEIDAMTGLGEGFDPRPALLAMAEAIRATGEGPVPGRLGPGLLMETIEGLYLPTLAGPEPVAADVEALAAAGLPFRR